MVGHFALLLLPKLRQQSCNASNEVAMNSFSFLPERVDVIQVGLAIGTIKANDHVKGM